MGTTLQEKFIVFQMVQDPKTGKWSPAPKMIEDTEDLAIMFINDAQARTGQYNGWSYASCPQRIRRAQGVRAGIVENYHVAKINDPNIRG